MAVDLPQRWDLAWRQRDYWSTVYKRTWRGSVITSFLTPLLYVLAMGVLHFAGGAVPAPIPGWSPPSP